MVAMSFLEKSLMVWMWCSRRYCLSFPVGWDGRKTYLEPFDDPSFDWSFGLVLGGLTFKIEVIGAPGICWIGVS